MRLRNLLAWSIVAAMTFLFSAGAYAAAEKVGYINLRRLVAESKIGKEAQKDIQKLRKKKEDAVSDKLKDINKMKTFINESGDKLPPSEKRAKIEELQRIYKDYQRMVEDAKEEIVREDRQLVAIILKKADSVLKSVAKKKNFAIILKDPNAIGYLDEAVDITGDVIKELNKK
ncbi:MAG: OmpH family outer membrane protein [Desulfobacterales bacterium]|nr:OmpH family outer membrane protein [Desulfobacterales bacterium]